MKADGSAERNLTNTPGVLDAPAHLVAERPEDCLHPWP